MTINCYRTMELDGEFAVVRGDMDKPRFFEAIAIFYDRGEADRYANHLTIHQMQPKSTEDNPPVINGANGTRDEVASELTEKQELVLAVLKKHGVHGISNMRPAEIARASGIDRTSIYAITEALRSKGAISYDQNGTYRLLSN